MNRRNFVQMASMATIAAAQAATGSKKKDATLNVGIIGCGARGLGAVVNILSADKNVKIIAAGELFPDKLASAMEKLDRLNTGEFEGRIDIPKENQFTGLDNYKGVLACDIDIVLHTTPPGFRPQHLEAAVEAGKHIFAEKPLGVDAVGIRKVQAVVDKCKEKGLSFLGGFCYRFRDSMVNTVDKIHNGHIGEIKNIQCSYNTGLLWTRLRQENWADMEYYTRNWYYYNFLSGDHIVEQGIHNIDKMCWVMGSKPPLEAYGMGGRIVRTDDKFGHIYDHFSIQYKFEDDVYANFTCRQQGGTERRVADYVVGTEGTADLMKAKIKSKKGDWRQRKQGIQMHAAEHIPFIKGIRSGKVLNNGDESVISSMTGVMGRMAAYSGKVVTWEHMMKSKEDLTPPTYDLSASMSEPPVAQPGIYELI
ncbi:MAG: Gfo/Idh/MocA family oxidoreductase [Lentisphaeraceae bacterium]|nr:Gfo/Idh/MocA family oxidoreductase [Lentisphaeraceae bacterium]